MNVTRIAVTLLSVGLASFLPQLHAATNDTLAKIKKTGVITLGARQDSIPFSYLNDNQQYQGYSIDLCMNVVGVLQRQLGMPALKVAIVPVTASTRIGLVVDGSIDLECGSTTNNLERQQKVAFAPSMFVVSNRLLSKRAANIKSEVNLRGKILVATAGTTSLKQLTAHNSEKNLGINIVTGKDHSESFLMVDSGRAVAEANDDILLAFQVATSRNPAEYVIGSDALSIEPYGIMLRRDDPAFKSAVDGALATLYKSDDIKRIYAKWFTSPIPPKGINLNFPMSEVLKAILANPTDSGNPIDYLRISMMSTLHSPSELPTEKK